MIRYSKIVDKNPREILLLRGFGCRWRKCAFCDYHLDYSENQAENLAINREAMSHINGCYGRLEVINSGSFPELGESTLMELAELCKHKKIHTLYFECHYLYKKEIPHWRKIFKQIGTTLKIKTGIETFDYDFRENVLKKGIDEKSPQEIAKYFDECCLLFGLSGQTADSMIRDIETGLAFFERVCVNIFVANKTKICPDKNVINEFIQKVMPEYINNKRVDILLNNTDFGVGGKEQ